VKTATASGTKVEGVDLKMKELSIRNELRNATLAGLIPAAVGLAVLTATAARAQNAPADSDGIQEIVVTAEKRSETLQSVPVSVTALTSAQLGQLKIDTASDLVTQVPNLQVNGIVGEGSPLFSLRGVSMFDYSLNQSSPVASYIDEVYKGNFVLFGVELYDLERIEVLRGPQGTLYGKNTTGGAINFITHKPGFDTEADIKVGVGNYNRREVEGDFQAALIPERVAFRFAFTYTKVDGFIQNVLPGHPDLEGVDQYGVRLSLLYKASDDLEFTLRFSKSMQDPRDYAIMGGRIPPPSPGNPGGVGFTGYFRTQDGTYTGAPLGNYQISQDYTPRRRQDNEALALTAEWRLSPTNKLTSITSWDEASLFNPEGTDGAPYAIWSIPYTGKTRQVTQDLRLTSTGDAPLRYILGAYYQHEIIFNSTENQIFTDPAFNTFNDYRDCAASSFGPASGYNAGTNINLGCDYYNSFDQIRNSWAVYTDDSYKLAEWITLRGGLRYNHDNGAQKNALDQLRGSDQVPIANLGFFSQQPNGTVGPTLALPGSPNYAALVNQTRGQFLHNTAVTGHAGVDFTLTSDALLYFNYSKGYRSAAFNAQFLFTPGDLTTVKPESLDSYEAGFKTSWLNHRVQINGAVFHYQYKDQQIINVYPTGQQPLINLGKSKIDGGELEVVTRPMRSLTLRASAGFLHSQVQDGLLATGSIDGQELPYAPHVSGTVAMDWEAWQIAAAKINLHLDANYNSKQFLALPNEDAISQGGYSLLNGRLSLQSGDDKWDVGVWGRNITNKFYLTNAVDVQGFGFDYRHVGTPRMFGVDAHYHF
jgi:iron complex outermembrane recepter protein